MSQVQQAGGRRCKASTILRSIHSAILVVSECQAVVAPSPRRRYILKRVAENTTWAERHAGASQSARKPCSINTAELADLMPFSVATALSHPSKSGLAGDHGVAAEVREMAKIQELGSKNGNSTISATTLSAWSREQKLAMVTGFAILGLLLALMACSKQTTKPALVGVCDAPQQSAPMTAAASTPAVPATVTAPAAAPKKVHKKRPATVTYSDPNSGISFRYPRKFELATGDKASQFAGIGPAAMNFVRPGGVTIATVNMPDGSYPGTDFTSAFFGVNVNRGLSEQECSQFAFVDTRDADGEPLEAGKVKLGSTELEKTSNFSADALKQAEAQYYHRYENGACYEFVLGLGTAGYGTKDVKALDRDQVFARLEKILETVKIQRVEEPKVAATKAAETADQSGK